MGVCSKLPNGKSGGVDALTYEHPKSVLKYKTLTST